MKDSKIMAKMGSIRDASTLVSSMINAGLFKPNDINEVVTEINGIRNRFYDWVFEDTDKPHVLIKITDGKENTINVKTELKELGFSWNGNCWQQKFLSDEWKKIRENPVFEKLTVNAIKIE